jgi:type IV secretory pathway TrbF-like protein
MPNDYPSAVEMTGYATAKRQYLEQHGDANVTNNYLRIALVLAFFTLCGSVWFNFATLRHYKDFRPLVIRIDSLGQAQAIKYDDFKYQPQDKEIRSFLTEFTRLYYARNRYTFKDNITRSLYFLDARLANNIMTKFKKDEVLENYLKDADQQDVDIKVEQVTLEEIQNPPYKATVDYTASYSNPFDPRPTARQERFRATFQFVFLQDVPNNLIPVNPLGISIQKFREDKAFN